MTQSPALTDGVFATLLIRAAKPTGRKPVAPRLPRDPLRVPRVCSEMKSPTKRRRKTLSRSQAFKELERLCNHYGTSARTPLDALFAVYLALQDGLIRIPARLRPRQPGPRPIWQGDLGFGLLVEVAKLRHAALVHVKLPRKMTIAEAVRTLQDREPKKWAQYNDLDKRYYDAKRHWDKVRKRFASELFNLVRNSFS